MKYGAKRIAARGKMEDSTNREIANRVKSLLTRHGVESHAQKVQEILGLSRAESYKKLSGTSPYLLKQLQQISQYFGEPWEPLVRGSNAPPPSERATEATLEISGKRFRALALIGERLESFEDRAFVAIKTRSAWLIREASEIRNSDSVFAVSKLEILLERPKSDKKAVAVLDDDHDTADQICENLEEFGYDLKAFYDSRSLKEQIDDFDAFIVDWKLRRETSERLIEAIRTRKPEAPILLLTGVDTEESDSAIDKLVRKHLITGATKPSRTSFIATWLDEKLKPSPAPVPS